MRKPQFIIVAGINGAGKSTLYQVSPFLFDGSLRLNADEILRQFGGNWKEPSDTFKAMRREVELINDAFSTKASFHIETTLSGNSKGHIKRINKAHELGYQVTLHYVYLDNVETAVTRVKHRVALGGHGIEEDVIRKRYPRSIANLNNIKGLVDDYYIWDNSNNGYVLTEEQDR